MIGDSEPLPLRKGNALLAIAVGGLIAGALDLTQACILFGWDIPLAIAGCLLGRQAFHGTSAPIFSASSCTSLSLARQRLFTTRPAAG